MIELAMTSILLLDPDGRAVPFDPERLRMRIERALSKTGTPDSELAADIALSIEFALKSGKKKPDEPLIRGAEVELMTSKVLDDIGYTQAAAVFRETAEHGTFSFLVEITRLRNFIEQEMPGCGPHLEHITRKVHHTLNSIGANSAAPALILELAKHFLLTMENSETPPPGLEIKFMPGKQVLTTQDIQAQLTDETALMFLQKRVLSVQEVDLRVFPVLRFHFRLAGIAGELTPPVTELALSPALLRVADAMDSIALAADKAWEARNPDAEVPLKTTLSFDDASIFVRSWMGCTAYEQEERCAASLAQILVSMTTRRPIHISCR
ncbi:MAG: hypothetical protein IKB16_15835 [Lentisphaeria bacterium]|nr:hypothetical protein [Lentisphaeria bacterium]